MESCIFAGKFLSIMSNNIDYSKLPRPLIYRTRRNPDEFGIDEEGTLNCLIHDVLYAKYGCFDGYDDIICRIFNDAYYMYTVALADSHPDRRLGGFIRIADNFRTGYRDYAGDILSILLIQINAHASDMSRGMKRLAKAIESELGFNKYEGTYDKFSQYIIDRCDESTVLPPLEEFQRPTITKELLDDTSEFFSWHEYFRDNPDRVSDFVKSLGRTKDEHRALLDFVKEKSRSAYKSDEHQRECLTKLAAELSLPMIEEPQPQQEEVPAAPAPQDVASPNEAESLRQQLEQAMARIAQLEEEISILRKTPEEMERSSKMEIERLNRTIEDMLVELIRNSFWGNEAKAREFLKTIHKMTPEQITQTVCEWLNKRDISEQSCKRSLWLPLHAAGIYTCVEQNWSAAIRNGYQKRQ